MRFARVGSLSMALGRRVLQRLRLTRPQHDPPHRAAGHAVDASEQLHSPCHGARQCAPRSAWSSCRSGRIRCAGTTTGTPGMADPGPRPRAAAAQRRRAASGARVVGVRSWPGVIPPTDYPVMPRPAAPLRAAVQAAAVPQTVLLPNGALRVAAQQAAPPGLSGDGQSEGCADLIVGHHRSS